MATLWICLLSLIVTACGQDHPSTKVAPRSQPMPIIRPTSSTDAIVLDMLNNIKMNGYDADQSINNGLGGLWINWRYGTHPLETNLNGSGDADNNEQNPPRHDPLTDLRYVHALWLYKHVHPHDPQFDDEIKRYTAIVKYEFAQPRNTRGWLYDLFVDLYHLSNDAFYQQTARSLADYFYTTLYHTDTGLVYNTSPDHPHGYTRVDLALEIGCALIQAGTTFDRQDWKEAGLRVVKQMYDTAYISNYHIFLSQIDNVLLPTGGANPNPTIFRGRFENTKIEGGAVRLGGVAQEALSLLHVYDVTQSTAFLQYANDLLAPLSKEQNLLGLWDEKQQGYFAAATFPGPDHQNPGTPTINKKMKESGRQIQMLEAYRVANSFTNDRYASMQDALLHLTTGKAYYAPGHGVLYRETAAWTPVEAKGGKKEDWITTEAMGIALEGLFSLEMAHPW